MQLLLQKRFNKGVFHCHYLLYDPWKKRLGWLEWGNQIPQCLVARWVPPSQLLYCTVLRLKTIICHYCHAINGGAVLSATGLPKARHCSQHSTEWRVIWLLFSWFSQIRVCRVPEDNKHTNLLSTASSCC